MIGGIAIVLLGSGSGMGINTVSSQDPNRNNVISRPGASFSGEYMYTGTVSNYFGQTTFYEQDSTSWTGHVNKYPSGQIDAYFSVLNGISVDKTTGFGVSYNDVTSPQIVQVVIESPYTGSNIYAQVAEYEHAFTAGTILWAYDVSYNLYAYSYEIPSDNFATHIVDSWSFEQSDNNIQTLILPVEFGD